MRELRADHGIEPTLDEILWLHELGKRVEHPIGDERLDLIGIPAKAGNVYLWPLTIMAAQWFNDRALPWFRRDERVLRYALAFALAHGRGLPIQQETHSGWLTRTLTRAVGVQDALKLDDLVDRDQAHRAVKRWARSLGCSFLEIEAAIDAVMEEPEAGSDDDAPSGAELDDIVNDLAVLTGTSVDYWRTQTHLKSCVNAYFRAVSVERARRGQECAPVKDALAEAIQDVRRAIVAIVAERQKGIDE